LTQHLADDQCGGAIVTDLKDRGHDNIVGLHGKPLRIVKQLLHTARAAVDTGRDRHLEESLRPLDPNLARGR